MKEGMDIIPVKRPFPHREAPPAGIGRKAFRTATPASSLSGGLAVRRLMLALEAYGAQNGLCARLRRVERENRQKGASP